jgi:hypothetical protein
MVSIVVQAGPLGSPRRCEQTRGDRHRHRYEPAIAVPVALHAAV